MALTFLVNGFVRCILPYTTVSSILVLLNSLEPRPSEIVDRTISPCYEDGSVYVTLWDTHGIIYQFVFASSYAQYSETFIKEVDDIIDYFNPSL